MTDEAEQSARELAASLDEVASSAGSGGGGAAGGIEGVTDSTEELSEAMKSVENSTKSAFTGIVTGSKSVSEALKDVLGNLANIFANSAFDGLFGSLFKKGDGAGGGILADVFGGFKANGGPVQAGKGYIVGERGPEFFAPSQSGTIIPNHALGGGGGQSSVMIYLSPGLEASILGKSANQAIEIAGASMAVQDRKTGSNVRAYSARKG